MLRNELDAVVSELQLKTFRDCEVVTTPSDKECLLVLMRGFVYMLPEEKTYRKVQIEIRRARK
jgi:hypothetical protein